GRGPWAGARVVSRLAQADGPPTWARDVDGVVGADGITRLRATRASLDAHRRERRSRRTAAPWPPPSGSGRPTAAGALPAGPVRAGAAPRRTAAPVAHGAVPSSLRAGIASRSLPSGPVIWWQWWCPALVAQLPVELVADGRVRRSARRVKRAVTSALWLVRTMTWSWPDSSILDEGSRIGRRTRADLRACRGRSKSRAGRQTRSSGRHSAGMRSPFGP